MSGQILLQHICDFYYMHRRDMNAYHYMCNDEPSYYLCQQ